MPFASVCVCMCIFCLYTNKYLFHWAPHIFLSGCTSHKAGEIIIANPIFSVLKGANLGKFGVLILKMTAVFRISTPNSYKMTINFFLKNLTHSFTGRVTTVQLHFLHYFTGLIFILLQTVVKSFFWNDRHSYSSSVTLKYSQICSVKYLEKCRYVKTVSSLNTHTHTHTQDVPMKWYQMRQTSLQFIWAINVLFIFRLHILPVPQMAKG